MNKKLHADHRTVFETEHGVLARKVAYFESAEDAQDYVKLTEAISRAEEIAKEASLMLEDDTHDYHGCRFTGAKKIECRVCLAQDKLSEIRVETLTQKAEKGSE